jgi:hypothetical protein
MLRVMKRSLASLHDAFASERNTAVASTLIVLLSLLLIIALTAMHMPSDANAALSLGG